MAHLFLLGLIFCNFAHAMYPWYSHQHYMHKYARQQRRAQQCPCQKKSTQQCEEYEQRAEKVEHASETPPNPIETDTQDTNNSTCSCM